MKDILKAHYHSQQLHPVFILTIDVEDWFQVENFKGSISFDSWCGKEIRVEKNIHTLLDLFDSIKIIKNGAIQNPKATFFVLGWLAERFPKLVREIAERGHEVASHGYGHVLCSKLSSHHLLFDLKKSKCILEDITGIPVSGYRAPSFDISMETLYLIRESGYLYDSSYNSFASHGRYGKIDFTSFEKKNIAIKITDSFYELPVSNLLITKRVVPWGGGGYFRMIPSSFFKAGVRKILKDEGVYLFYTHPWEFDPDQPRVHDAPVFFKFRHYINLRKTKIKLKELIELFSHTEFLTCESFINKII